MKEVSMEILNSARKWCQEQYNKRRGEYTWHVSFLATEILEEAEKKFNLNTFGVEGFSSVTGKHCVDYLNTGETYGTTIIFRSKGEKFSVGCWVISYEFRP